nr:alpha-mannosidase [Clostridiales bacterium]
MAHIKVTRRGMTESEWNDLRFNLLKRAVYPDSVEIETLKIRDARQIGEMQYDFYKDGWRKLNRGDMYFTPDGTAFIEGDYILPERFRGQKIWLKLKTAAEMIVKCNGKYVGGIDPNRERILLSPYIENSNALHFEIEGYNRSKPDDERNPESLSVRGCRQVFEGAYIVTVDEDVLSLVYDIEALSDMAGSESFSEDYRTFLTK